MKLKIINIGKIKEATVEIKGITVIGGENNTGKSTVGKTLYAVFNSMKNIEEKIKDERINSIVRLLNRSYLFDNNTYYISKDNLINFASKLIENKNSSDIPHIQEAIKDLLNKKEEHRVFEEFILKQQTLFTEKEDLDKNINDLSIQIERVLNLDNESILGAYIDKALNMEFLNQVSNIYTEEDSQIVLTIKNNDTKIEIKNNSVSSIENPISLKTETLYIYDPYILVFADKELPNRLKSRYINFHRFILQKKIMIDEVNHNVVDELLVKEKLDEIYKKINKVCDGDIVKIEGSLGYKQKSTDKILNYTNLSTGLKSFAILKDLLKKGAIETNGTIILDEPEVHIHPKWQLLFAELIVLLHKEFNLHILLNTHSPYFLHAIEVYAAKYGVADSCKYYLSELEDKVAVIKDVTNDVDKIYDKLAQPLQDLEDEELNG